MSIEDAFVAAAQGVPSELSEEVSQELQQYLGEIWGENESEGEDIAEQVVTLAGMAFLAGRAYGTGEMKVAIQMGPELLNEFMNYLATRREG